MDGAVRRQHLGKTEREEGLIAVVLDGEKIVERVGFVTNNQAEYMAIIRALEFCISRNIRSVIIFSDSELVVKQIKGEYAVRNPELLPYYERIMHITEGFDKVEIRWIQRDRNKAGRILEAMEGSEAV